MRGKMFKWKTGFRRFLSFSPYKWFSRDIIQYVNFFVPYFFLWMSRTDCTMFNWARFRYCFALNSQAANTLIPTPGEFTAHNQNELLPTIKRHSPREYATSMRRLLYTVSPSTIAISLSWTLFMSHFTFI